MTFAQLDGADKVGLEHVEAAVAFSRYARSGSRLVARMCTPGASMNTASEFLWLLVRRQKIVPFPKPMPEADVQRLAAELARVIDYAHSRTGAGAELVLTNSAQDHWVSVYRELTQEHGEPSARRS
jgi:hypothetical protein